MKSAAAPLVKAYYKLPLSEEEMPTGDHNSQDVLNEGAKKVEKLLYLDDFTRDGEDTRVCLLYLATTLANTAFQNRANNYTHPVFRDIILAFFYSSSGAYGVARHFPEHFTDTIPDSVLVLVVTVVR